MARLDTQPLRSLDEIQLKVCLIQAITLNHRTFIHPDGSTFEARPEEIASELERRTIEKMVDSQFKSDKI